MPADRTPALKVARAAWSEAPDWIEVLALEVEATSQSKAARRLSLSAATISMVLRNRYAASTRGIEARVRDILMTTVVACPHDGAEISRQTCAERAAAPMPMSSPTALRAWSACRTCPHAKIGGSKDVE